MNGITRKSCLPLLLLGTLVAICFSIGIGRTDPARSRVQDGSVRVITYSGMQLFGLGATETAEFCVGTGSSQDPDVTWGGFIADNAGKKLFQLPEKRSPAGTWTCSEVPRTALGIGDPDTGRIKVAAHLFAQVAAGTKSSAFVGAFDIASVDDGTTVAGGLIFWAVTHDNDV